MKLISVIQELKKKRKYSFAMNSEFFLINYTDVSVSIQHSLDF